MLVSYSNMLFLQRVLLIGMTYLVYSPQGNGSALRNLGRKHRGIQKQRIRLKNVDIITRR